MVKYIDLTKNNLYSNKEKKNEKKNSLAKKPPWSWTRLLSWAVLAARLPLHMVIPFFDLTIQLKFLITTHAH